MYGFYRLVTGFCGFHLGKSMNIKEPAGILWSVARITFKEVEAPTTSLSGSRRKVCRPPRFALTRISGEPVSSSFSEVRIVKLSEGFSETGLSMAPVILNSNYSIGLIS